MTPVKSLPPHFEQLLAEHGELQRLLQRTHKALSAKQPSAERVAGLLTELEDRLECHFAHEEMEGYFAEIIAAAPWLATQVDALRKQHAEFLQALHRLGRHLDSPGRRPSWPEEMGVEFSAFLTRFVEHERSENRLLHETYNRDVGAAD